ncbi:hypothetical protein niasHS_008544 [Heterodera schachtii]|uniref:C2H2-type domain-containing protein n=1 Tax=Heterodera schachtii TaxID=97005 RepID=A0ABD2JEQ1_HETSC
MWLIVKCDLRTGTGQICRSRFATSRSLQMHKVKGHTALRGAARMFAGNICPVGCANKKSFRAHTKRKHPETATPPALVEGAMVIPYKPGVAIFMGISRGLGYPVAIYDEKSTDVNLAAGELSFAAGQFYPLTQQAISGAAFQARTLSEHSRHLPHSCVAYSAWLYRRPFGVRWCISCSFSLLLNRCVRVDVAFSGRIGLEGQVQHVSRIVEKVVVERLRVAKRHRA